jgi:hypothetical protein
VRQQPKPRAAGLTVGQQGELHNNWRHCGAKHASSAARAAAVSQRNVAPRSTKSWKRKTPHSVCSSSGSSNNNVGQSRQQQQQIENKRESTSTRGEEQERWVLTEATLADGGVSNVGSGSPSSSAPVTVVDPCVLRSGSWKRKALLPPSRPAEAA